MLTAYERSDLRLAGVYLLAAKLFAVPLIFDARAFAAFPLPKSAVSYALAAALAAVLVLATWRFRSVAWRWSPVHAAVVAVVGCYVASAALAVDPLVALIGAPDRSLGLLAVLDNAITYCAIVVLVRTPRDALIVGSAILLAVLPVVAYALVQWAGLDPLPWASGLSRTRPFSTLGNAGALAQYLATLAPAALVLAAGAADGARRRQLVLIGIGVAALLGTFVSAARASLVGLATAALLFVGLHVIGTARGRTRALLGAAYAGSLLLAVAVVSLSPVGQRVQGLVTSAQELSTTEQVRDGSVSGRATLYDIALRQLQARPLLGVGPDNFTAAFGRFRPAGAAAVLGSETVETSTHSWVFKVATDVGLVGLASFVALIVLTLAAAIRSASPVARAAAVGIASFLGTGLFSINDVGTDWLLWAGAGVVVAATQPVPDPVPVVRSSRRGGKRRARAAGPASASLAPVLAIALVLLPAVMALRSVQAAEAAGRAASARLAGRAPEAAIQARTATGDEPWRAEYWQELGLAHTRVGQFDAAVGAFRSASDLAPYHVVYLTNLARAHVARAFAGDRGAVGDAHAALARAEQVDPNASLVHYTRALALFAEGRPVEAAASAEHGAALMRSSDPFVYEAAARAYEGAGRLEDAIRWARAGLGLVLTPDQAVALRFPLVRALITLARYPEARTELDVILTVRPTDPAALALQQTLDDRAPRR